MRSSSKAFTIVGVLMAVALSPRPEDARTVRLPAQPMGTIYIQDVPEPGLWKEFSARGTFTIPAGKKVRLRVRPYAPKETVPFWGRMLAKLGIPTKVKLGADLSPLEALAPDGVEDLGLNCPLSERGLSIVGRLKGLERLSLRGSDVTDAGLAKLRRLESLRTLDLSGAPITDAGLAHVTRFAGLERLGIGSTKISDTGLRLVEGLTSLTYLSMYRTEITDAGLAHLRTLKKLRTLHINQTQVRGEGLVHLRGLPELRELWLLRTPLTEAGLEHLEAMPSLRCLDISLTPVPPAAVERLRKAVRANVLYSYHPHPEKTY